MSAAAAHKRKARPSNSGDENEDKDERDNSSEEDDNTDDDPVVGEEEDGDGDEDEEEEEEDGDEDGEGDEDEDGDEDGDEEDEEDEDDEDDAVIGNPSLFIERLGTKRRVIEASRVYARFNGDGVGNGPERLDIPQRNAVLSMLLKGVSVDEKRMIENGVKRWKELPRVSESGSGTGAGAGTGAEGGCVSFIAPDGLFSVPLADFIDADIAVFSSASAPLKVRRAYALAILANAPRVVMQTHTKNDVRDLFPDSAFIYLV